MDAVNLDHIESMLRHSNETVPAEVSNVLILYAGGQYTRHVASAFLIFCDRHHWHG